MATQHRQFEWDPRKAAANEQKHGIRFDDAAAALAGTLHQVEREDWVGGELRARTIVADFYNPNAIYAVIWTRRGQHTRLISARKATSRERRNYERERD